MMYATLLILLLQILISNEVDSYSQHISLSNRNSVCHFKNSLSHKRYVLSAVTSSLPSLPIIASPPVIASNKQNAGDAAFNLVTSLAEVMASSPSNNATQRYLPVSNVLLKMRKDMELLDDVASRTPQLSNFEVFLLASTVVISSISPAIFSMKVVEVLIPAMAALSTSVGISSEYLGKAAYYLHKYPVAVCNGKEVAALAIQAAAESEVVLAQAERVRAVLPLAVGIATTASAIALLVPNIINELSIQYTFPVITELYLISPIVAVLAAAIAGLASQESCGLAYRASGVGNRRFASSKSVGRTWLSATEQVDASSRRTNDKWVSFALGVLPSPLIAALCPGSLPFKAIVCSALASAQSAYYLSIAEYSLASAVDAVALKSRTAAVVDTYANQGGRAGSVLPLTSALGGLFVAGSAVTAELLPFIGQVELQVLIAGLVSSGSAIFAAAAAVSKAKCEVDSVAASAAAADGISDDSNNYKPPYKTIQELIQLTLSTTYTRIQNQIKKVKKVILTGFSIRSIKKFLYRRLGYIAKR